MKVKLNESTLEQEELSAISELFSEGFLTMGKKCLEFEDKFAKFLNVKNAVMVNSGSSANLLAFFLLANPLVNDLQSLPAIEPGSEIIVPALTWSTSVWPIIQIGCTPVFVDSNPQTLQVDLDALEAAITPKTRAICAPHILGNAIDLVRLKHIKEKYNLWLIEDTCEGLGVKNNQIYAGTVGDFGTYSFYFSHHITTVEGGMVVTNNDALADLLRAMRSHGWVRNSRNFSNIAAKYPDIDPRFLFVSTGFNLRPTDINATLGLIQLDKLERFNKKRNEIANLWNNAFQHLENDGLLLPMAITPNTEPAYFGYPVFCKDKQTKINLMQHLESNNIETRPIICGNLAKQPALNYHNYRVHNNLSGADQVMDNGLYWGLHPIMSDESINYVISVVEEFFK